MCKQVTYTKYQKRVIKFLYDFLGNDYPFDYEKAQNNHLKVLIEGVPKPMYTSSTPSDMKSLVNFKSDIKREIKRLQTEALEQDSDKPAEQSDQEHKKDHILKEAYKRLIMTSIKNIRSKIDIFKSREEEFLLEHRCLDGLKQFRLDNVRHVISQVIQQRKSGTYLKHSEKKSIENEVLRHMNFLMPSIAYYSDYMNKKNYVNTLETTEKKVVGGDCHDVVNTEVLPEPERDTTGFEDPSTNVKALKTKTNADAEKHKDKLSAKTLEDRVESKRPVQPVEKEFIQLMNLSVNQRIEKFRGLSKSQMLGLIDELNQAMALNREQDINEVIHLIRQKDIPIEVIISRLEEN